jgi:hypothetical protein
MAVSEPLATVVVLGLFSFTFLGGMALLLTTFIETGSFAFVCGLALLLTALIRAGCFICGFLNTTRQQNDHHHN